TAYFKHESGLTKTIDGFYYKHFERNISSFSGSIPVNDENYKTVGGTWDEFPTDHRFRIRFAPPETGKWSCFVKVVVSGSEYTSGLFDFIVVPSNNLGYVKVGSTNRFLVRGSQTYVPVGPNYIPETKTSLHPQTSSIYGGVGEAHRPFVQPLQSFLDYENNLNLIANSGANHFRFLMCPWSYEIEFENIGNYYDR